MIYDTRGSAVRHFEVRALLGRDYFTALPRSVSSMQWHGDARIRGEMPIIPVTTPDGAHQVEIALDLATGAIAPVDDAAWRKARAAAGPAAEAGRIAPGALFGNRIYVAIAPALWPRVSAALAPSGATLIHLDLSTPIPQRPERMPDPAMRTEE